MMSMIIAIALTLLESTVRHGMRKHSQCEQEKHGSQKSRAHLGNGSRRSLVVLHDSPSMNEIIRL